MSANVVSPELRLACATCEWVPPEDAKLEAVLLHVQVEHAVDDVEMRLVALCPTCRAEMQHTETKPTGGGWHDWFRCPECSTEARVKRRRGPGYPDMGPWGLKPSDDGETP